MQQNKLIRKVQHSPFQRYTQQSWAELKPKFLAQVHSSCMLSSTMSNGSLPSCLCWSFVPVGTSFQLHLWCVLFMLIISWAHGETLFWSLHNLCAQLGIHGFLPATTFTTRSYVTLKSCDFLMNTSRWHKSEDKNAWHTGSASVLHVTTWKSTIK